MNMALGLIEAKGLTTAVAALDAASKAASVTLVGFEKIIGVEQAVGVNIQIAGEVAAVQSAVDAGMEAGNRVGMVISSRVIPRPHDELSNLIEKFGQNVKEKNKGKESKAKKTSSTKKKATNKKEDKTKEVKKTKTNKNDKK
ncbi:MAG TPA: BMC domain-containing protein [Tissierellaceae bacterium]|nr:BMC domain-containing protein [Tissierellaceae bacterium]